VCDQRKREEVVVAQGGGTTVCVKYLGTVHTKDLQPRIHGAGTGLSRKLLVRGRHESRRGLRAGHKSCNVREATQRCEWQRTTAGRGKAGSAAQLQRIARPV
jgi:hypothetical protein